MAKHRYDLLVDPNSFEDHLFTTHPSIASSLPSRVSLFDHFGPVLDQGDEGSCTAHAGVGMMEYLANVAGLKIDALSRQFLYYVTRALEGDVTEDAGASIRDVMKALNKTGVCSEALWKYVASNMTKKPSAKAYADAVNHKLAEYKRVSVTVLGIKQALASGFPVDIGITVWESFESDDVAKSGLVPMPEKGEDMLGGHSMLCGGYDDSVKIPGVKEPGAFQVRNSWGDWGQGGNCWIPYGYLGSTKYGNDYWTGTGLVKGA